MDLRDIQRLHAQFAPDSMTIDLPRQIAALPAPADVTAGAKATAIKLKLPKGAPVVRRSVVAVAIAAVVAMAGMGAASLYKSLHTAAARSAKEQPALEAPDAAKPENKESRARDSASRPIDAEPPHPVAMTPTLTAKDLAPTTPIGLTADQFKSSLGTTGGAAVSAAMPAAKPAAALSNEDQRAAASPIRQSRRENEAPVQDPVKPTPSSLLTPTTPLAPAQSAAQATALDRTSPRNGTEAARSHSRRHHSRSRDEQVSDADAAPTTTTTTSKQPASSNRSGTNEVQMF